METSGSFPLTPEIVLSQSFGTTSSELVARLSGLPEPPKPVPGGNNVERVPDNVKRSESYARLLAHLASLHTIVDSCCVTL